MRLFRVNLLFLVATLFVAPTLAQETEPTSERPAVVQESRAKMLRQLGLNRDQIQRLQRINRERKPLMDAAQDKLREANRSLDDAIYSDDVDEPGVQAKIKDVQAAQAEVFRIRFTNELAIRRLLTPEQLVRFRDLRQRFERARQEAVTRPILNRMITPRVANPTKNLKTPAKTMVKSDGKRFLR